MQRPKDNLPVGMFQCTFGVSCRHQHSHPNPAFISLKSSSVRPFGLPDFNGAVNLGMCFDVIPSILKHMGIETMCKRRATGYGEL